MTLVHYDIRIVLHTTNINLIAPQSVQDYSRLTFTANVIAAKRGAQRAEKSSIILQAVINFEECLILRQ